jgi:hypothetical protein
MTENSKRAFARWLATWGAPAAFLAMFAGGLAIGLEGDAAAILAFFPAAMIEGLVLARKRKGRVV